MAKIKVLFATPATARDCRVAVPIFKREHAKHFAKSFHFTIEQRQQRFRRLIAFGQTGPASYQYDLHLITGDPCGNPARIA